MARLFAVIETPEPGWTTRKIEHHTTLDTAPEWHVELVRERDGATVNYHHESLHVAWLRAVEQAHMLGAGLDETVDREALDREYMREQREALRAAPAEGADPLGIPTE